MSQDVVNCPSCSRRTPAARAACLYCGVALPVTAIEKAPPQRNLDTFTRAFNAVLLPSQARDRAVESFAAAFDMEPEEAQTFVLAEKPLPVARCQLQQEAEVIAALIESCELSARVIADEQLRLETELVRARRLAIEADALTVVGGSGEQRLMLTDIRLLVLGYLKSTRVDYTEASGATSKKSGVMDTAEYGSEEILLDVYATRLDESFRIKADSFDYSGLVAPLAFRTEENFQKAVARLRSAAPQAVFDEDFARLRTLLARAWPPRSRSEAQGLKRTGLSLRPVAKSSVTSDNRDQFERYSRLMFLMIPAR